MSAVNPLSKPDTRSLAVDDSRSEDSSELGVVGGRANHVEIIRKPTDI